MELQSFSFMGWTYIVIKNEAIQNLEILIKQKKPI